MNDIYRSSLQAKYDSIVRVISIELSFGDDLSALTPERLAMVHSAAEQAILEWAAKRDKATGHPRPISNLQHLLNEYCAIADHL